LHKMPPCMLDSLSMIVKILAQGKEKFNIGCISN
jgi:hypothetical protein